MSSAGVEQLVSRETIDELRSFERLVLKWNKSIQLVSRGDQKHIWQRHILDSIQWVNQLQKAKSCVDVGSGGGFPGIAWAILAKFGYTDSGITLVERDIRKAAFLRTCKSTFDLNCNIVSDDIRNVTGEKFDFVSARALAQISELFEMTHCLAAESCTYAFPKGRSFQDEIKAAEVNWSFSWSAVPSQIDPESQMVFIKDVRRVR